ncbi:hypothetical protein MNR01_10915 [Lysobacter sp. S4-A87]|uniref:hypothetical protein n=1 Tax=Lysobacter sp. S4-A87 TaxID=2925843 RepID=UPI001F52FB7A|nr:hypothetical protein [Lysobacter sp. S4-A87]UNK48284.1 hypothetical protein MNR01_10915 [Lysobacter sp. S4-A87]
MTPYQVLVSVHGAIGVVALATFWSNAALRKGTPLHRRVGRAFLLAMAGILVTGAPMAWFTFRDGRPVTAAFLAYLVVITASAVWSQWRAIRDQGDVARYTGPVYVALGALSLLSGVAVLALGMRVGSPLLMGFSAVGLLSGAEHLYKWRHRAELGARGQWWLVEHYNAVLGNGIATHIAFLSIGLPRLLPSISGGVLGYLAWFGPLLVAVVAKVLIDRRWKPREVGELSSVG